MTTSRLFPATNGPGAPAAYAGPFIAGVGFQALAGKVQWLQGYWAWVPPGGDTVAETCALWAVTGATTGTRIAAADVATSGTLIAGQWNPIMLATPVPLAPGTSYVAQRGWTSVNGFPDTNGQFATGGPYVNGITSGALFAYGDGTAGAPAADAAPYGRAQGLFSTASADARAVLASTASSSGNFWTDVLVSDQQPAGFSGTYRLYPNNINGNPSVTLDLNVNYNVGTVFTLSAPCPVVNVWFLSPPGATGLPTRASIWSASGLSRTKVINIATPSWSGAAGANWVSAPAGSPVLPAGTYVVACYNSNGTVAGGWNAKDSATSAFGAGGPLAAGIVNGPLSAPGQASAPLAYDYNGALPAASPPYSAGTSEGGQCAFGQDPGGLEAAPWLYAGIPSGSNPQNYFVDVEVGQPAAGGWSLPLMETVIWP